MRFAGIDIASEEHVVAVVGEGAEVLVKPAAFGEDAAGYARLLELLGPPEGLEVAMEATGHYWQNLFAVLAARGHRIALLNPLRTHCFVGEDLPRAKTDAIDALGIARFAAQKRPAATVLPDSATEELRELVRLRDRTVQEQGDKTRHLHRLVDLGFPEFRRHVRTLDSMLATAVLRECSTAEAFRRVAPRRLAALRYDGRHKVGKDLAQALVRAAKDSVGQHHGPAYQIQVRYLCDDIDTLRARLRDLEGDIENMLRAHEVGSLLTTINGLGPQTAARLVAELGGPARFRSASALASFVGPVPATNQSGKHRPARAGISRLGHARLRHALWMPTLTAVRVNPWLRAPLPAPAREGQAAQGRPRGLHAQAAHSRLQRREEPAPLHSPPSPRPPSAPRMSKHKKPSRRRPPSERSTLGEAGGAPQKTLDEREGISTGRLPLIPRGVPGSCPSPASTASAGSTIRAAVAHQTNPPRSPRLPRGEAPPEPPTTAVRFIAGDHRLPVLRLRAAA
jgi:transposase